MALVLVCITFPTRLDYQPLFGKMSPCLSLEGTAGVVSLALSISTNEKRACTNRAGLNYLSQLFDVAFDRLQEIFNLETESIIGHDVSVIQPKEWIFHPRHGNTSRKVCAKPGS